LLFPLWIDTLSKKEIADKNSHGRTTIPWNRILLNDGEDTSQGTVRQPKARAAFVEDSSPSECPHLSLILAWCMGDLPDPVFLNLSTSRQGCRVAVVSDRKSHGLTTDHTENTDNANQASRETGTSASVLLRNPDQFDDDVSRVDRAVSTSRIRKLVFFLGGTKASTSLCVSYPSEPLKSLKHRGHGDSGSVLRRFVFRLQPSRSLPFFQSRVKPKAN
jgi:hypothetical protein